MSERVDSGDDSLRDDEAGVELDLGYFGAPMKCPTNQPRLSLEALMALAKTGVDVSDVIYSLFTTVALRVRRSRYHGSKQS